MEYRISTKGVETTEALKNYLEKRLEKIDRVVEDNVRLDVKLEKDSSEYVGKIMVHYLGKDLVVSEKSTDVYNLIDLLTDSFEKKIKRERDYVRPTHKANVKGLGEVFKEEMPEEITEEKISNVKRVNLMITSLEEAIAQMDVMNHEFFVFRNMETNEINMLIKGKNGGYVLYEFQE
ncbi:30S ribosomal protein S30 [Thermosipho melanesiensis]|uniref:Sigma 54 modulation protein/ribosomal protein S30EA n=2 Tax=Thermosipho melanesiensis TaxID=46541 RepID=A6LJQ7_THEM4|nr:ribosome-associated translation inhibitor RaiA [Thermosipho melanesiensis]ABR30158.1 sigma 54 modulation protein/ribosomal protein S30EA [Thermosipho melanesiensis BI429]APT73357.1 sigma 54 modulation protein / 30S ribosomal protein S30 [Thermosipho melanesiensis]OOC38172.1 30S ribosomal protein S30 [Thermosipho melanesiensis]OOC40093.1 30S ribosomal protein S30 [Thermosipho melanesiensis]OOC40146.1 30S ribosomal protein S30 [Thermosipho melanesiensis]